MKELYDLFIQAMPLLFSLAVVGIGWFGYRLRKRIVALEESREKGRIEFSKSARLSTKITQSSGDPGSRLYIVNSGECEARNIKVTIDGTPIREHTCFVFDREKTIIGPRSDIWYHYIITNIIPELIVLTWDDDFAEGREWRSSL